MNRRTFGLMLLSVLIISLLLLVAPVYAQEPSLDRDPAALAQQLLGYDGSPNIPELFPAYNLGDSTQFWVSKANQDTPTQITAELAAETNQVYVWVEEGIHYDPEKLVTSTQTLDVIFSILRATENQGSIITIPRTPEELNMLSLLRLPDVDNDPHIYILFARNLIDDRFIIFNPNNSLPVSLAPGSYTNQHEMLIVNTSVVPPDLKLDNDLYVNAITQEFYSMLTFYNTPGQAPWLREAFSNYTLLQLVQSGLTAERIQPFLSAPYTSLTQANNSAADGAGQLFLQYVQQRLGSTIFTELYNEPGMGLTALDQVLAREQINDLNTGLPVTADDIFADFVMTNMLNSPIGDGRFAYAGLQGDITAAVASVVQDNFNFQTEVQRVPQLGTFYMALTATAPASFTLYFNGQDSTGRLAMPSEADNHFYWSGNGLNQATSLTRSFDLTGVTQATLNFDAWYTLTAGQNYAYVQVSEDGGLTWDSLNASNTVNTNPYGLAYGPSFTDMSNTDPIRPYPYLGIELEQDGLTIATLADDSPAGVAGLTKGDIITGHDGKVWDEQSNLNTLISEHNAGDTINLYIKRGSKFFSTDVVLGADPELIFRRNSLWLPQTIDLSAYAGRQIQIRFQYISVAEVQDYGFAVDNISLPEINFSDDAESGIPGWTLNGFQQMTNLVPQHFVVQFALLSASDPANTRVVRLIRPDDTMTSNAWNISLDTNDVAILAVSGLNDDVQSPAVFTLAAQTAGQGS